jgi:glycosyltransferase involved in cell wall biosynthesis
MLAWEWVRPSHGLARWRRERALHSIDQRARKSAASAALTFLHTPAAVERYRLAARHSMMIRQPGHELSQVIAEPVLDARLQALANGAPLRLTSACRHAELKGLDLLIRAIGLLNDRGVKVELALYGQGPETQHLQSIAAAAGVAGQVHMPGSLRAGEELDSALRASDLFVMPHRTTDFGRAFFDAMAAGLPVLAFRTPASATTVYDGQDGFLAPLDDVQGLAERISWLHTERATLASASRAARRRALENTRSEWFRIRANWTLSLLTESTHAA